MTDQHPITPPSSLLGRWEDDILNERENVDVVLDCAWKDGFRAGASWRGRVMTDPMDDLRQASADVSGVDVLSPAAQVILDAVCDNTEPDCDTQHLIAAALRAAADQCQIEWNYHPDYPETEWVVVASDLTAIADELEGQG